MQTNSTKSAFLFNEFLSSITGQPLELKYKDLARILQVSESTLSKLRHGRLTKFPMSMHADKMAAHFADGVMQSFSQSGDTARRFMAYARMINENYFCSEALGKAAVELANAGSIDDEYAKNLYNGALPQLIELCYEEAYANTEMNYSACVVNRNGLQSEITYQKVCDIINHDTFDDGKLKNLLNVVYAANIRRQITNHLVSQSFLDQVDRYMRGQADQPFYISVNRTEVISISEDSKQITRSIKGNNQIVLQTLEPHEMGFKQLLNHVFNMSVQKIIQNLFQDVTCEVNHIPLIAYINMHEGKHYTSIAQLATAKQITDGINGTVSTELVLRFNIYPSVMGETINICYGYICTSPFIRNVTCNYSYCLRYPCKFFEHEFMLDARTREKWGVRVKLFTPITTSVYTSEDFDTQYIRSNGTSDSKRVTFYDWAIPGSGYYRNLYELEYTNSQEN